MGSAAEAVADIPDGSKLLVGGKRWSSHEPVRWSVVLIVTIRVRIMWNPREPHHSTPTTRH